VIAGAFQIIFRVKIHANDVFLFLKNHFWHQHIKTIQNIQIILNFNKKKKLNFLGTQPQPHSRTSPSSAGTVLSSNYKKISGTRHVLCLSLITRGTPVQMSSPRGRLIQASDSRTLNYKNERTMGVVISNKLLPRSIETGTASVHVKLSNNVAMSESLMVYRNKNLWSDQ